jgi:putative endonuclease
LEALFRAFERDDRAHGAAVTKFFAVQLCHSERSRGISGCKLQIIGRDYNFWIYIVTNKNHSVLYIGVTNSLSRRTWEHREGNRPGFAADYRCTKLVYYEWYRDIRDAIARESQLKKWSRGKKVALVNRLNPSWRDLGADVLQDR